MVKFTFPLYFISPSLLFYDCIELAGIHTNTALDALVLINVMHFFYGTGDRANRTSSRKECSPCSLR